MGKQNTRWVWGLLLGSLAAIIGIQILIRSRSRGNTSVSPVGQAPDEVPSPEPPVPLSSMDTGAEASPASGTWLESLRLVMEKSPYEFGFDKSAWSAPLLSRYLRDVRGIDVPLPLLRKGLKDLGYRWEQTHYVRVDSVTG